MSAEVPHNHHPVVVQPPRAKRTEYPFTGFIDFQGIEIDVENRKGDVRRGKDKDGHAWAITMQAHYGEVRGTEGVDGDKLDVYVGPNHDSSLVVVIRQHKPDTGAYDEDKVMLGWDTVEEAVAVYKKQYDRPGFYKEGDYLVMPIGQFWRWVRDTRNHGKKVADGGLVSQLWGHLSGANVQQAQDAHSIEIAKNLQAQQRQQDLLRRIDSRQVPTNAWTVPDPDYPTGRHPYVYRSGKLRSVQESAGRAQQHLIDALNHARNDGHVFDNPDVNVGANLYRFREYYGLKPDASGGYGGIDNVLVAKAMDDRAQMRARGAVSDLAQSVQRAGSAASNRLVNLKTTEQVIRSNHATHIADLTRSRRTARVGAGLATAIPALGFGAYRYFNNKPGVTPTTMGAAHAPDSPVAPAPSIPNNGGTPDAHKVAADSTGASGASDVTGDARDTTADPYALGVLVQRIYGAEWVTWAPSVIRTSMLMDHNVTLSARQMNKLMGWKIAAQRNEPWTWWEHFHAVCNLLNGHDANLEDHAPHTVGEMMLAVDAMTEIRRFLGMEDITPHFSEEVARYIAACAHMHNCWTLIAPIDFALPYAAVRRYICHDCGRDSPVHFDDGLCDTCCGRVTLTPESLDGDKVAPEIEESGKEQWMRVHIQPHFTANPTATDAGRGKNITLFTEHDPIAPIVILQSLLSDLGKELDIQNPDEACAIRLLDAISYLGRHTTARAEMIGIEETGAMESALKKSASLQVAIGDTTLTTKFAADTGQILLDEMFVKTANWWQPAAAWARAAPAAAAGWAKAAPGAAWQAIKAAPGQAWDAAKAAPGQVWDAAKAAPGQAWDAAKAAPGQAWDWAKAAPGRAWNSTVEGAHDGARVGANMLYRPGNVVADVRKWNEDTEPFSKAITGLSTAWGTYQDAQEYDHAGTQRGTAERALGTVGGLWGNAAGIRTGFIGGAITNTIGGTGARVVGRAIDRATGFRAGRRIGEYTLNADEAAQYDEMVKAENAHRQQQQQQQPAQSQPPAPPAQPQQPPQAAPPNTMQQRPQPQQQPQPRPVAQQAPQQATPQAGAAPTMYTPRPQQPQQPQGQPVQTPPQQTWPGAPPRQA